MENNFIQMANSAGHPVAYTIVTILKHIIDCMQLYFTNGLTNINIIMRSSKTRRKILSLASAVWHVAPSCWNQMLPISSSSIFVEQKFVQHSPITIAIDCNGLSLLIFEKNGPIMPLDRNPHQIVTRFGCVGFSMYASGFSVSQMRQCCLFTYPPRSKWASSEKMFFFLPKSASRVCRSQAHLAKRIHNHIRSAEV